MNIWHDISPKRITKDKFYAEIEISKGGKKSMSLTKKQVCSSLTVCFLHQLTILPTTALFREPLQMTAIRLMFLFCAVKQFSRWRSLNASLSAFSIWLITTAVTKKLLQFPLTIPTTIATATSANFRNTILRNSALFPGLQNTWGWQGYFGNRNWRCWQGKGNHWKGYHKLYSWFSDGVNL